jgi:transposase
VECAEHGVGQVSVPWALPHGRFTALFERWIIDVLHETGTVSGAVALLGITWDEGWGVMDRAVRRGRQRKEAKVIEHLGVDEKAFRKGHSYVTVVCDIDKATVEHVADDRKADSLGAYLGGLSQKQLWGIKAIAMDMWDPYFKAACDHIPLAEFRVVFDRFHIMKHMGEAVDKVRRQEHRELKAAGGKDAEKLTGTRYLWLSGEENVPPEKRSRLRELVREVLRVGRAWAWKESLRDLWSYSTQGWVRRFFSDWYAGAIRSRLEPVKKVARMLKSRLENIVSYCRYPITNGVAEGLNSKIMTIKRKACGFANREHFKTAIYFHCGGLSLYPEPSGGG